MESTKMEPIVKPIKMEPIVEPTNNISLYIFIGVTVVLFIVWGLITSTYLQSNPKFNNSPKIMISIVGGILGTIVTYVGLFFISHSGPVLFF